jgi:tyrosinase
MGDLMITRRSILLNASAVALSNLFRSAVAQEDNQIVRYGAGTPEGKQMLRVYAQGVAAMKVLPPQDPRSWTFQWYVHATPQSKPQMLDAIFPGASGAAFGLANDTWFTCQPHQGQPEDYFLPWHRLYVMQFEEIIRTLTGRDDFTLPYWDYTSATAYAIPDEFQLKNRDDPALSPLFVPNRNKDGGNLRSADVNAGEPLNKYFRGRQNFLVLPNLGEPSYSRFCSQLDRRLHGEIHEFTGDQTNMASIATSAGDPIFWLHHCNIDRIWAAWNASGGKNPTSTNGINWADTNFVFAGAEGQRVEINISTISGSAALSYKYDSLPGVRPGAALVSSSSQVNVLLKSVGAGVAAASVSPSQPAAAVTLGWAPVKAVLAPTASQNQLSIIASSIQTAAPGHLVLLLKDVQAHLDPNTVYQVFLDLPENASDEVQDRHYVGLLNFFGMVTQAGHAAHGGRDFEFDVTDLIKSLSAASALQRETSVTIAPVGAPAASSMPMISGGIEVQRR